MRGPWLRSVALIWSATWASVWPAQNVRLFVFALFGVSLASRRRLTLCLSLTLWLGVQEQARRRPPPLPMEVLPKARAVPPRHRLTLSARPRPVADGCSARARWWRSCDLGRCQRRQGELSVSLPATRCTLEPGDTFWALGFVYPPPGYGNPGSDRSRHQWRRRGLRGRLFVARGGEIALEAERAAAAASPAPVALRQRLKARLSGPAAGLGLALTLGDRSRVDPKLTQALRRTGTAHILAVSGAHVGLLLALTLALLHAIVRTRWARPALRRWSRSGLQWLLGSATCWLYVWLSGQTDSAQRAAVMATFALSLRALGLVTSTLNLICTAAVSAWLLDPLAPFSLGLNLSLLGATGAWIGARSGRRRSWLYGALSVTCCASAMTAPLAAPLAGGVPLVAPLLNLLVVPWVGGVMLPVSLLTTTLVGLHSATTPLANAALEAAYLPLQALSDTPLWRWPWLTLPAAQAQLTGVTLAASCACLGLPNGLRWSRGLLVLGALAVWLSWPTVTACQVRFLDVGHGDATLIRTSAGETILIDGGGRASDGGVVGARAVVPALRAIGVGQIDLMVLSHAHPDHENGLLAVAQSLPVRRYWAAGPPGHSEEHRALQRALRAQGTERWHAQTARLSEVTLERLWPPPDGPVAGLSLNDNSLVLRASIHGRQMLLSGDVERRAEALLLPKLSRVDLLKVPHHGSDTSSTRPWLRRLRPKLSVAGARRWGVLPFPSASVLRRYAELGLRLWVTDDGHVAVDLYPNGEVRVRQGSRRLNLPAPTRSNSHSAQPITLVQPPRRSPGAR